MSSNSNQKLVNRSFIRRLGLTDRYNLSFLLTSIVPLIILTLVILIYVRPALVESGGYQLLSLNLLLFFVVFLAILGFFVSRSATQETIDKLTRSNHRMQHLFDISQSLSNQVHLDVLLDHLVKASIEMTEAAAGILLLRDEEQETLRFEISIGTGAVIVKEIPLGTGIAGWVAEHQKMMIVNNVQNEQRYQQELDILPNFSTCSVLAVPLSINGKNLGVLELLHRQRNQGFTDDDGRILRAMANQASIFIQNVQYREEQQNFFIHVTELLLTSLDGTRQFWPGHLKNSARYSNMIGRRMNLSNEEMRTLHYAALLHDIGFININLQEKPSRKTIETHPELGYEMILPIVLLKKSAPIIRYHHERFDGSGYPHKIAGTEIPLGSRILAVAETFDVLTNPNSYRKIKLGPAEALKEIRSYAGTQFDPEIIQVLAQLLDEGVFKLIV